MTPDIEEHILVETSPERAYESVADVRKIARWSPECFAVWIYRRRDGVPTRFVGFNRRHGFVWFTTCRVLIADPGREFAFDVYTFGQPVARWGYRFAPVGGGTQVTEYWIDRRSRSAYVLGRIFTGKGTTIRPEINRAGMQKTLLRLKHDLEQPRPDGASVQPD